LPSNSVQLYKLQFRSRETIFLPNSKRNICKNWSSVASEEIFLQLIRQKCMPILLLQECAGYKAPSAGHTIARL